MRFSLWKVSLLITPIYVLLMDIHGFLPVLKIWQIKALTILF